MVFNSHFYYVNDLESSSSNLMGQPFINERFVGSRFSFFHKKWSKNFLSKKCPRAMDPSSWAIPLARGAESKGGHGCCGGHDTWTCELEGGPFVAASGAQGRHVLTWQIFGNYVVPYTPNGKSLKIEWGFFWGSCNSLKVRNL